MPDVILKTDIPGLTPFIRGKVRDVYDLGAYLLIVTTDRISAFDSVLPTGIPDKGRVLNLLSAFWFERNEGFCPHHMVTTDGDQIRRVLDPHTPKIPDTMLDGRAMLVRKTEALPVECVVRGYLEGSAWQEYRESRSVCGIELPEGLVQGSPLPQPIFTPATKATTGHDLNITHQEMSRLVAPEHMRRVMDLSLEVYTRCADYAQDRGILIADTKFEFGILDDEVLMIDECLTPDSSRFWDAARWAPGGAQPSYDKQFVRDYLDQVGWDHEPPAPALPPEVAEKTAEKYRELYRRITASKLS